MGISCGRQDPNTVPSVQESNSILFQSIRLNDLALQRVIGTGNYAQVWLARLHDWPVAVKIMNKAHLHREKQVQHVFTEKRVLCLLRNPFIVNILGTCQDDINLFCVMDYAAGGELFSLMTRRDRLPKVEACFYIAEIVQGLCALHAINCLYRDIKPENVLLAANGHIKLADLGFAKLISRDERTYTKCGTPEYIAPEVIDGSGSGLELDWWQVGILLYEMLSGKTPFMDNSPYRLYEKVLTASPNLSSSLFDESSRSLLRGLLTKSPKKRITQAEIRAHPFFKQIIWEKLLQYTPPFVPRLVDPFDSSLFDQYSDERPTEELETFLQSEFEGY
jgi:protein kinase A